MQKLTEAEQQERIAAAQPFEDWYASLQDYFEDFHDNSSNEMKALVTGESNHQVPIHRWYSLKESFAAELPHWLCRWMQERYNHVPAKVLDPFMGAGTTGVSLAQAGKQVIGVEYNPFIRAVAQAKGAITQVNPGELSRAIACLEEMSIEPQDILIPQLATLHNTEFSNPRDVKTLRAYHQSISRLDCSSEIRLLLQVGLAASVESIFHLRKDGRALRYQQRDAVAPLQTTLFEHLHTILTDVQDYHQKPRQAERAAPLFSVYAGGASNLRSLQTFDGTAISLEQDTFDTIMYSPPYLNNFDYTEIYKLELWLLGFVSDTQAFKQLRLGTVRSHFSIAFPETNELAQDPEMHNIARHLEAMTKSICLHGDRRSEVERQILGYFDDMYLALREQWRVLKPGGVLVYIVANSRHQYLPIATDVILGAIAYNLGFTPLDIVVFRHRNGRTRQKLFLRESAVFLQKPETACSSL
jgi:DNA modification methylase